MTSAFWLALAGGALGWVTLSFVGAPVRRFLDLRGEVIRRLTEFANVRARWKEVRDRPDQLEEVQLSEQELARLEEAQRVIRDLASQMRAIAENEPVAMWFVRLLCYDPVTASAGLIGLANAYDTYGGNKNFQRQTVNKALRINI
jgi:predicted DsbA family dithiol-disulfide isomerase